MRSLPFGSPRDLSAAIRYARTRVTATVFADRTGDARLEPFRTMAADWVARPSGGCVSAEYSRVDDRVPSGYVPRQLVTSSTDMGAPPDDCLLGTTRGSPWRSRRQHASANLHWPHA